MGKHLHVFHRCRRKDAMSEIEDVARASADAAQHGIGLLEHPCGWSQEEGRVEVPLNRVRGSSDPITLTLATRPIAER